MLDLQKLLSQVQQGGLAGERAMAVILRRYDTPIRGMARRLIGPQIQSQIDVEDLIQHAAITLWLGLRTGRFFVTTSTELMSLIKVLLRRKVSKRWQRLQLEMNATMEIGLADTNLDQPALARHFVADPCHDVDFRDFVEHFLDQLSPTDRDLMNLRLSGHSTAEAARQLGVDAATLRVRLTRLRRRLAELRKSFSGHPEEPQ